ncbi:DMT family transporter [Adlercreutzia murintestinalis]|uniref:DMT family transporter n=1 Tax=Adlercreutzia murintestinalis TaxID=2941325 RepID=UPI00203D765C|nr:DMT family transporter [Adlercreutzia murintestinalis]
MKYGLTSGILWGLDTVILGIGMSMAPFIGTVEALALAAIVGSALHDVFCAIWLFLYMLVRGRLKDTVAALKTRSGKVVMLGALLGGPVGMTGYVIAINNIGAGYTAIISSFYPAFGTVMAVLLLKETMSFKQVIALIVALGGIIAMGYLASDTTVTGDPVIGLLGAFATVVGWGSEAVICAWGMRDDNVDNETALQIRETTSALVYCVVVLPVFGAWLFTVQAVPTLATGVVALAALTGSISYLFYYKGISRIGAAKAMALNISYSAWAVLFGLILLGTIPGPVEIVCCIAILAGTILAASDWKELFSRTRA